MTNFNTNPLLNLNYESAIADLGDNYYDEVSAADFTQHILRFRNDSILPILGLTKEEVTDNNFIECFGKFESITPFLALRYHGYQFGEYNPFLGDGRGFLYGQIRGIDHNLYDLGTKGSGRTPYSRSADGRLTLKGGIREVLAAETLHQLGVNTSRCFCLIETGEQLWRMDEPSPTRSSVMVRFSKSHIRFGTFERLYYLKRSDLIRRLLDHVIYYYYPTISNSPEKYSLFYGELVERVAQLAAQWMAAGFCHGVLNTDNMSITGESFDYGPYAFIPTYNSTFVAAYFDYGGRYSYGNQPFICKLNLEKLQLPLALVIPAADLANSLVKFDDCYANNYQKLMLKKLGFQDLKIAEGQELLKLTIELLQQSQVGYHQFFAELAKGFNHGWCDNPHIILENANLPELKKVPELFKKWCNFYQEILAKLPLEMMDNIGNCLLESNPKTALLRPIIEDVWEAIAQENNWQPFKELVTRIQQKE
jgi:serine/tyrosine/threonine adenylyltransferase